MLKKNRLLFSSAGSNLASDPPCSKYPGGKKNAMGIPPFSLVELQNWPWAKINRAWIQGRGRIKSSIPKVVRLHAANELQTAKNKVSFTRHQGVGTRPRIGCVCVMNKTAFASSTVDDDDGGGGDGGQKCSKGKVGKNQNSP